MQRIRAALRCWERLLYANSNRVICRYGFRMTRMRRQEAAASRKIARSLTEPSV